MNRLELLSLVSCLLTFYSGVMILLTPYFPNGAMDSMLWVMMRAGVLSCVVFALLWLRYAIPALRFKVETYSGNTVKGLCTPAFVWRRGWM